MQGIGMPNARHRTGATPGNQVAAAVAIPALLTSGLPFEHVPHVSRGVRRAYLAHVKVVFTLLWPHVL
jgi:hypothetical protein